MSDQTRKGLKLTRILKVSVGSLIMLLVELGSVPVLKPVAVQSLWVVSVLVHIELILIIIYY